MTPGLITPTLAEMLEEYARGATQNLHVALPGTVLEYDPATNTADIELQVSDSYEDDEGEIVAETYPPLIGVPVVFPRAKKAFFAWEVERGDRVAVMFASQAIDQWLGTGTQSAPGDLRRHDLSHAFAVPGLYPMTEPVPAGDRQAGGAALGVPGGPQIRFTPTGIKLGSAATKALALAEPIQTAFTALWAALDQVPVTKPVAVALAALAPFTWAALTSAVASSKVTSE
jgi:Phage protein Gp138 N-terminal domain